MTERPAGVSEPQVLTIQDRRERGLTDGGRGVSLALPHAGVAPVSHFISLRLSLLHSKVGRVTEPISLGSCEN